MTYFDIDAQIVNVKFLTHSAIDMALTPVKFVWKTETIAKSSSKCHALINSQSTVLLILRKAVFCNL